MTIPSPTSRKILYVLGTDTLTPVELRDSSKVKLNTLHVLLKRMLDQGWIKRQEDPIRYSLSREGRKRIGALKRVKD